MVAEIDIITLGAAFRLAIYIVPLLMLLFLVRPGQAEDWSRVRVGIALFAAALVGHCALATLSLLGATRELLNVLSIAPAALLSAFGIWVATYRRSH